MALTWADPAGKGIVIWHSSMGQPTCYVYLATLANPMLLDDYFTCAHIGWPHQQCEMYTFGYPVTMGTSELHG
jgi:hypothetical protein